MRDQVPLSSEWRERCPVADATRAWVIGSASAMNGARRPSDDTTRARPDLDVHGKERVSADVLADVIDGALDHHARHAAEPSTLSSVKISLLPSFKARAIGLGAGLQHLVLHVL